MSAIKFIISILFVIVIAAFAVLNRGSVPVAYYDLHMAKQTIETPLIFVALVPLILGFLLAMCLTVVGQVKSKAAIGKRNRTIVSLEKDLERLKPRTETSEFVTGQDSH